MALHWDLTEVVDRSVNFPPDEDGLMNDMVHLMIWWTIPVGIGRITEDNASTFWARLALYLIASGYEGPVPTRLQVRQLVGLSTNAGPKTDEEFQEVLERAHARSIR